MAIESPMETVYYYECSNGQFRLVYFIPPDELQQLIDQRNISSQVLEDFPDGVDLDVTKPDFDEFQELYEYRPQIDPDELHRAFFAIFSTTFEWENFRGSGFIPADDLEKHVSPIEENLRIEKIIPEEIKPLPKKPSAKQRRQRVKQRAEQQSYVIDYLVQMQVEGIDPKKTLRRQQFSKIKQQEGESAEQVFSNLLLKRKR